MNLRSRSLAAALPLLSVTGCAMFSADPVGLTSVDDLVGCVERVHVDVELTKDRTRAAADKLNALVAPDFRGDAVLAYSEYLRAVERCEAQQAELESSIADMKDAADPVFEQWSDDLESFSSPGMRQLSERRYSAARGRYEEVVTNVDPAMSICVELNESFRDYALFLGHDFNAQSVSEIRGDVRAVVNQAAELDGRFRACLQAAREYVETAALPVPVEKTTDG